MERKAAPDRSRLGEQEAVQVPFTVEDFHSLVRLLEQHPEWRAELRRLLLSEELLTLPQLVRELAENIRELGEKVRELAEAQRRTQAQVAELAEAQRRTEKTVGRLVQEVGTLRGRELERSYREWAPSRFQALLRRIRLIDHHELGRLLDEAVDRGRISLSEKAEVLECDLVLVGRREDQEVYLVGEVSVVVDWRDVQRAAERAALLQKATGAAVLGVAAGEKVTKKARQEASRLGVHPFLDGKPVGSLS